MAESSAKKSVRSRSRRRVEGDGDNNRVAKSATHRSAEALPAGIVALTEGVYEITCQASELVPVAQYANVTVGPIAVRTVVTCGDDMDALEGAIVKVNSVIQGIIADDRETVEESVRLHNQREAEEQAKEAKGRGK